MEEEVKQEVPVVEVKEEVKVEEKPKATKKKAVKKAVKKEKSEVEKLTEEVCAKVYRGDVKLTQRVVKNIKAKTNSDKEAVQALKDILNTVN